MLYKVKEAVIAIDGTTSEAVDLENFAIMGLLIPTLNSGNLTFTVSDIFGGTYQTLASAAAAAAIAVVAGTGNFALGANEPYRFGSIQVCEGSVSHSPGWWSKDVQMDIKRIRRKVRSWILSQKIRHGLAPRGRTKWDSGEGLKHSPAYSKGTV